MIPFSLCVLLLFSVGYYFLRCEQHTSNYGSWRGTGDSQSTSGLIWPLSLLLRPRLLFPFEEVSENIPEVLLCHRQLGLTSKTVDSSLALFLSHDLLTAYFVLECDQLEVRLDLLRRLTVISLSQAFYSGVRDWSCRAGEARACAREVLR